MLLDRLNYIIQYNSREKIKYTQIRNQFIDFNELETCRQGYNFKFFFITFFKYVIPMQIIFNCNFKQLRNSMHNSEPVISSLILFPFINRSSSWIFSLFETKLARKIPQFYFSSINQFLRCYNEWIKRYVLNQIIWIY